MRAAALLRLAAPQVLPHRLGQSLPPDHLWLASPGTGRSAGALLVVHLRHLLGCGITAAVLRPP